MVHTQKEFFAVKIEDYFQKQSDIKIKHRDKIIENKKKLECIIYIVDL